MALKFKCIFKNQKKKESHQNEKKERGERNAPKMMDIDDNF